jgi:ligand-binding sensor domain-containing protein
VAQSEVGILWHGATTGAYRFDGVSFERIPEQEEKVAQSESITASLALSLSNVRLGHLWAGISDYRDGKLFNANLAPPHGVVRRIVQDRDGVIWVAADGVRFAGLLRYDHGK